MIRAALGTISLGALALFALACAPEDPQPRPAIVQAVPWSAKESLSYNLVAKGGEVDGRCLLTTEPDISPGRTQLSHLCSDTTEKHRDDRITAVAPTTLAPLSAMRTIVNLEKNTTTTYTSTYDGNSVALKADVNGKTNDTSRKLPPANRKVTEPTWYDDESLFWIVRSVTLKQGFEGTYTNLNAANGRVFDVRVKVESQESTTVPAGTFTAWKVRIQTDSVVQEFWIDAATPHRVVRARIERINYVLTAIE